MKTQTISFAAVLAAVAGSTQAAPNSTFPAVVDASSLDGTNGFLLRGIDAFDDCGISVSSAGDVNNDGIDDVIVGAFAADPNGMSAAGETYVVFGRADVGSSGMFELSSLNGTNGFVIEGSNASDRSGFSVSGADDLNGDGIDDLLVGASGVDNSPNGNVGATYVIFGGAGLGATGTISLSSLDGSNGYVINGASSDDQSGRVVSSAGDVNNDGNNDIFIGARLAEPNGTPPNSGAGYVVFGGAGVGSSGSLELSALDGSNGFVISNDVGARLDSFSTAGDVNGDGIDDVVMGSPSATVNGIFGAGQSYVVFGSQSVGGGGSITLSSLDGTNGFVLNGVHDSSYSGTSVSSAGDVNGDGVGDLVVGAPYAHPRGECYVVYGGVGIGSTGVFDLGLLDGSNGVTIRSTTSLAIGESVSSAGDLNSDGINDIVVNSQFSGEACVIFGNSSIGTGGMLDVGTLDGSDGFIIHDPIMGEAPVVSSAGDINGDGVDDIIIGAHNSYSAPYSGECYVVFGRPQGVCELGDLGVSSGVVINGVAAGDFTGFSVSGAGDFNGDGIKDVLIGSPFADTTGSAPDGGTITILYGDANLGSGGPVEISGIVNYVDGVTFGAQNAGVDFGFSVAPIGDFNDDGIDDIIAGARGFDAPLAADTGAAVVVFGTTGVSPQAIAFHGPSTGDNTGSSVSGAGDVNGDGIPDIIIGALASDANGNNSGSSYVVFGDPAITSVGLLDLSTLDGTDGFVLNGVSVGDFSGDAVSSAGDINNDGIDDLLIASPFADSNSISRAGECYVVFGSANVGAGGAVDLNSLDGTNGFTVSGPSASARIGSAVSSAGDVNNDGVVDLILGADAMSPNGISAAGQCFVVFGGASVGSSGLVDLATLDGTNGVVINGTSPGENVGISVSFAGDVNGDQIDDVIVGGYRGGAVRPLSGNSYVLFGASGFGSDGTIELTDLGSSEGILLRGADAGEGSGISVAGTGDVNDDCIDDYVIGAYFSSPNGLRSGRSYIVYGTASDPSPFPADLNNDRRVNSADLAVLLADWAGTTVDLNGDMIVDSGDLAILLAAWTGNTCGS